MVFLLVWNGCSSLILGSTVDMGKDVVVTIVLFAASIGYFTLINWWMMDIQGLDYWYMFRTGAEISAGGH